MTLEAWEAPPHPAWDCLPLPLWAHIVRDTLAVTALDGYRAVLRQAAVLLAVSQHVAAAAQDVPLSLDLTSAPEADLLLLPPLLTRLPLRTLRLAPRHAGGAEALLRCRLVEAASAASLHLLAATVACTDTLQRFPALSELHLHAGVLERLYPAVLHGLPSLRALGLHGYQEVALAALPPSVAASLHQLEVTPRPEALRCQLEVRLPAGAALAGLTVHGSFQRVLSAAAAPQVFIDTAALARQCRHARIEAQEAVWLLSASCRGQEAEVALAAALLEPGAVWRRLELRLLEGACVEMPPALIQGGSPPARCAKLDLSRLGEVLQHLSHGGASASLQRGVCSIFHPWILTLERTEGGACSAGSGEG
ncbi:hypothetical protein ABPG75_000293 [Micractinium tetrahymenae]